MSEINKMLDKLVDDMKYGFDCLFDIVEEQELDKQCSVTQRKKLNRAREIYKEYFCCE